MSNKFKQQAAQKRAAVPQVDLESVKATVPTTAASAPIAPVVQRQESTPVPELETPSQSLRITQVDTRETPTNRGFSMYPSRHRQIAKDLAYLEDRNPWQIIDDALEEYVVKHYGKEYKRN